MNGELAGCVIAEWEENHYDDSDFVAVWWDEATQTVKSGETGSTRYGGGQICSVDVIPSNLEKAQAWNEQHWFELLKDLYTKGASVVKVGKTVRVVHGRKVAIGTEGEVFWQGEYRFARGHFNTVDRVGLKLADGTKVFTSLSNVEVTNPGQYIPSDVAIRQEAFRNRNDFYHFHYLYSIGLRKEYVDTKFGRSAGF